MRECLAYFGFPAAFPLALAAGVVVERLFWPPLPVLLGVIFGVLVVLWTVWWATLIRWVR